MSVSKKEVATVKLAEAIVIESVDVQLEINGDGWKLTGKNINDYRALRALLTNSKGEDHG